MFVFLFLILRFKPRISKSTISTLDSKGTISIPIFDNTYYQNCWGHLSVISKNLKRDL